MVVTREIECLIHLETINKSYQQLKSQQIIILENIRLELRPGEILAWLCPWDSRQITQVRRTN